jgi:hypothetical protein
MGPAWMYSFDGLPARRLVTETAPEVTLLLVRELPCASRHALTIDINAKVVANPNLILRDSKARAAFFLVFRSLNIAFSLIDTQRLTESGEDSSFDLVHRPVEIAFFMRRAQIALELLYDMTHTFRSLFNIGQF